MSLFPVPVRNDFSPERCVVCGYAADWIVFEKLKLCRLHLDLLAEAIKVRVQFR